MNKNKHWDIFQNNFFWVPQMNESHMGLEQQNDEEKFICIAFLLKNIA